MADLPALILVGDEHVDRLAEGFGCYERDYAVQVVRSAGEAE